MLAVGLKRLGTIKQASQGNNESSAAVVMEHMANANIEDFTLNGFKSGTGEIIQFNGVHPNVVNSVNGGSLQDSV